MQCNRCRNNVPNNVKFCPECGFPVAQQTKVQNVMYLKCKNCSGEMVIDDNQSLLCCPYCGSKEVITESDEVKIAKIKTNAYRDVEMTKQYTAIELNKMLNAEKEKANKQFLKNKIIGLVLIILSIIVFVFCVDNQNMFSSGMRLIVTIVCIVMIAFGIWFLARKKNQ